MLKYTVGKSILLQYSVTHTFRKCHLQNEKSMQMHNCEDISSICLSFKNTPLKTI